MASAQSTSKISEGLRTTFGVVLFVAWAIETILWVYNAIHSLIGGEPGAAIRGICALLLMLLLAGMEGLEVAVIDRWNSLYPDRSASDLAGWLAARQLFVALIVTTATLLAEPDSIPIPFTSMEITGGIALKAFTVTWTGFTVLWFMQIVPKHMAADESGPLPTTRATFVVPARRDRAEKRDLQACGMVRLGRRAQAGLARRRAGRRGGGRCAWRRVPDRIPGLLWSRSVRPRPGEQARRRRPGGWEPTGNDARLNEERVGGQHPQRHGVVADAVLAAEMQAGTWWVSRSTTAEPGVAAEGGAVVLERGELAGVPDSPAGLQALGRCRRPMKIRRSGSGSLRRPSAAG